MSAITSANLANAIVKLVAAEALPALSSNLVMGNIVNRDYEPVLASSGDTVNVPISPSLTANNIAEGGNVNTQNPNLGNAQIVLNTHIESSFMIPDVTKVLAVPDLLKVYMQPAVIAIAERIESDLLNLYSGFSANTPIGSAGTALTEAVIDSAETALFKAKMPVTAEKYLVLSADEYSNVRQIPRFSEQRISDQFGNVIAGGGVGKLKDFTVMRSQLVVKTGSAPVNTHNIAFGKDAIALIIRKLPQPLPGTGAIAEYAEMGGFGIRIIMSYNPNSLAQQFTVDCLYGAAVLRNAFGLQVNS